MFMTSGEGCVCVCADILCNAISLQISRTPFQDPQSGADSLHPTKCWRSLRHSGGVHRGSQTVPLCGSVKEWSIQRTSGRGALSLHLPSPLQVI